MTDTEKEVFINEHVSVLREHLLHKTTVNRRLSAVCGIAYVLLFIVILATIRYSRLQREGWIIFGLIASALLFAFWTFTRIYKSYFVSEDIIGKYRSRLRLYLYSGGAFPPLSRAGLFRAILSWSAFVLSLPLPIIVLYLNLAAIL